LLPRSSKITLQSGAKIYLRYIITQKEYGGKWITQSIISMYYCVRVIEMKILNYSFYSHFFLNNIFKKYIYIFCIFPVNDLNLLWLQWKKILLRFPISTNTNKFQKKNISTNTNTININNTNTNTTNNNNKKKDNGNDLV
jgi:hypothetical protein